MSFRSDVVNSVHLIHVTNELVITMNAETMNFEPVIFVILELVNLETVIHETKSVCNDGGFLISDHC